MTILVFSDTHQDINSMTYIIENENPNMVIHLGDNTNDALICSKLFPEILFERVGGNCDFEYIENDKTIEVENKKLFITHGHKYWVKSTYKKIIEKGHNENVDVIMFGHTHKAYIDNTDTIWVINPGSISNKYTRDSKPSYAKIIIEGQNINCEIIKN